MLFSILIQHLGRIIQPLMCRPTVVDPSVQKISTNSYISMFILTTLSEHFLTIVLHGLCFEDQSSSLKHDPNSDKVMYHHPCLFLWLSPIQSALTFIDSYSSCPYLGFILDSYSLICIALLPMSLPTIQLP